MICFILIWKKKDYDAVEDSYAINSTSVRKKCEYNKHIKDLFLELNN